MVGNFWIWRANCVHCSTPFYIRDLDIWEFWYSCCSWNQWPAGQVLPKDNWESKVKVRFSTSWGSVFLTPLLFKCQQYIGQWSSTTSVTSTEMVRLKQISVHFPALVCEATPFFLGGSAAWVKEQNIWLEGSIWDWEFLHRVNGVEDPERKGCSGFGAEFGDPATQFPPLEFPPRGRSPRNNKGMGNRTSLYS